MVDRKLPGDDVDIGKMLRELREKKRKELLDDSDMLDQHARGLVEKSNAEGDWTCEHKGCNAPAGQYWITDGEGNDGPIEYLCPGTLTFTASAISAESSGAESTASRWELAFAKTASSQLTMRMMPTPRMKSMSIDAIVDYVITDENDGGCLVLAGENRGEPRLFFRSSPHDVTALNGLKVWGGSESLLHGETEIAKRIGYTHIEFTVDALGPVVAAERNRREGGA